MKLRAHAVVVLLFALALPLAAQDAAPNEWYVLYDEAPQPSMMGEYESATRDFVALLREKKAISPNLAMQAQATDDFHYYYFTRIPGLSTLESYDSDWATLDKAVGADKLAAITSRSRKTLTGFSQTVLTRRVDLSYVPATPRLKPAEAVFVHYDFYYLVPGKEGDAEAVARDLQALARKKKVPDSYSIYQGVFGGELPLMIVAWQAKSSADFSAAAEKNLKLLGDEGTAITRRLIGVSRKAESREARLRPDLSYTPPGPGAK